MPFMYRALFFHEAANSRRKVGDFGGSVLRFGRLPGRGWRSNERSIRVALLGRAIFFLSQAKENQDADQRERHKDADVAFESRRALVPPFAEEIAEGDECARPEQASQIGKACEGGEVQFGRARCVSGQVPDARNKIAEHQDPLALAAKPLVRQLNSLGTQAQKASPALRHVRIEAAPQAVTHCDATDRPQERGGKCGSGVQLALKNEVAYECQQRLVWNRQPDYTQREQRKYSRIAVMRDQVNGGLHHGCRS